MKYTHFKAVFAALTVATLLFFPFGELSALDVGSNMNSRSVVRVDDTSFENLDPSLRNTVSAWVRHRPVVSSSEPTGRFLFESSVTNLLDMNDADEWESQFVFDVDVLRLDGTFPQWGPPGALVRLSAGRFPLSEPSGLVFSDRVDGASLTFDFPDFSMVFAGGYTGLLAGENSGVVMTSSDLVDASDSETLTAPNRLLATAHTTFPEAFGTQSVDAGVLAQWDQRSEFDATGEKLDSQYLFAAIDGPFGESMYYDAAFATSLQQRSPADVSEPDGLADAEFGVGLGALLRGRYYLGASDSSVITAEGRFGSGDGDTLTAFTPVTDPSLNLLNPVSGEDSLALMLDYAWRPFAGEPGSKARSLELSAYGAVSTNADPTAAGSYQGTEAGTRVTYRPLSDLGGRLWLGTYMPSDIDNSEFIGRIEFSSSF
ncbi:MAG: hypothetical protein ACOC0B_00355 [bacterium]